MWEKTRNGKRRLKSTAVPTIFNAHVIPANTFQREKDESITISSTVNGDTVAEHSQEQEKILMSNGNVYILFILFYSLVTDI